MKLKVKIIPGEDPALTDPSGFHVARVNRFAETWEDKAHIKNAKDIVKAVNHHEQLLRALEAAHYALCKFAENEASREIKTAGKLLKKLRTPNLKV